MKLKPIDENFQRDEIGPFEPLNAVELAMPTKPPICLVGHYRPYHVTGEDAPHAFMLIEFINRKKEKQTTLMPASHLLDPKKFMAHIADRFFDWASVPDVKKTLTDIVHSDAPADGIFTTVPGWHGDSYCRSHTWIRPPGNASAIRYQPADGVKSPPFNVQGTLKEWQEDIAKLAHHSSRMRLALSVPFAATVMRLVGARPFGINFVGPSSIGKTLSLYGMASVIGTISSNGLPHLGSTLRAIEEMRLANRDGVTIVDEVAQIQGDKKKVAEFLKALSFMAGTARPGDRASAWEKATNAAKGDCPTILAITSEIAIAALMRDAAVGRLTGESVRLIDQPALSAGAIDIFDGAKASERIGADVDERRAKVESVEQQCRAYQGVAHVAFLEALVAEGISDAEVRLRRWMAKFDKAVAAVTHDRAIGRIASSYALIYAAARLAIDYGVLPWKPKPTLRDIRACFMDAVALMKGDVAVPVAPPSKTDDQLIAEFQDMTTAANLVRVREGEKPNKEQRQARVAADGLRMLIGDRKRLLFKPEALKRAFPAQADRNRLVKVLRARRILLEGRDPETATRQVQIQGLEVKRPAFYVLDWNMLERAKAPEAQ
ncbi:MAG: DUF927 domain-containing protein [Phreatobacter sp.]|uniref:DUF927 domain-containing protein n=1 Tax=Phreatobacter sp. TaxID=1966341 RepID=UPI001A4A17F3|nr:DUF927 domain-containing protein [Phreatobacter sp.]MBL8571659.1 DUF927 domain-containing protein [Phreatobacter sp.]